MTAPEDDDRTASLMTPAKLAQLKVRTEPAASPGAWLDKMATDAGSGHVRRLLELRQQLEATTRGREGEFAPAAASCKALHVALDKLDFALVQPRGLLARAMGKSKGAASSFSAQHGKVVQAGDDLAVKVSVRPYRGDAIQREVTVKIPAGLAKGDHRILLSDADTLNRMQSAAGFNNRFIDVPQAVSLLNQERSNNRLYVSLVKASPTAYYDDKTMPSMPSSVLNVIQSGRASNRAMVTTPETASEQASIPFDYMVTGSYSIRIHVK